ncbi:hypothetical protein DRO55_05835 [Candidatus Bathyarchaeota archaeon]|nr:MAG: hypothetical protein DRO55_05835 [Candidatus Bathyarchaeota archaeon]
MKTINVKVKFIGIFKGALGGGEASIKLKEESPLRELIRELAKLSPRLGHMLIDPELGDPRPNAVILVNGMEITILNGLDTRMRNGDEVVLIPVTHGG